LFRHIVYFFWFLLIADTILPDLLNPLIAGDDSFYRKPKWEVYPTDSRRIGARFEQVLHRSSGDRIFNGGCDFGQGKQNESTNSKGRMREFESRMTQDAVSIEDKIDIDVSRTLIDRSLPPLHPLNIQATHQDFGGLQVRFDSTAEIDEIPLVNGT